MKKYTEKELNQVLKEKLYLWRNIKLSHIEADFKFKDFKHSIKFVNQLAEYANDMDHHPDITIKYDKVILELATHSEKAITNLDIELAQKIQDLYNSEFKK